MPSEELLIKSTPDVLMYSLVSVIRAVPLPTWLPENEWYRYTLQRDESVIVGYQVGTLASVTEYATTVAEDLNLRKSSQHYKLPCFSQWKKRTV